MFLKYFYSDNNGLLSVHFTGQTFVFGFRPSTVIDSMIIPYRPCLHAQNVFYKDEYFPVQTDDPAAYLC